MISLRKFIETEETNAEPESDAAPESDSGFILRGYQAALQSMGASGGRALPVLGDMIPAALTRISDGLEQPVSPESIHDASRAVDEQLSLWADEAELSRKENERTIRQFLRLMLDATESNGIRDERFTHEINDLSNRLRKVAGLDNLPLMRRSIEENADALTSCVARVVDEGRESIRRLNSEIAEYQTRLLASERRALVDTLTGLANRRAFEQQLELRVQSRKPFSLLVADLNGFKSVNDLYGHLVGDEILKRFAHDFKAQFLPEDTVARWGGDEFIGIVAGPLREVSLRADRVRHWVLGEHKINVGDKVVKIRVDASLGSAAWNGSESGSELFARADKEMYQAKEKSRELV